ncbi:MAG TPA: FtsX-like permease family protein [Ktedonobacteraceae bacterium]|nr:FtsX-like permease family protein [Ktedonobacteraceae bacterium]
MWQLLFSTLRRQRGQTLLAAGGFFLAACTLILLTATTQGTVIRANQIISQNWRPTYDLEVLPAQAHIPDSKLIPADFIAGNGGGISMEQYKRIQHLPGVEVAAPVAYLGYVQIPSPIMGFAPARLPGGYYQVDWTLTASNGKQTFVERQERFIYEVTASCPDAPYNPAHINALLKAHILPGSGNSNCGFNGGVFPQTFQSIDTGPFLLTAIDPTAEDQLVHIDRHITNGRMLTNKDTIVQDPNFTSPTYQVPLLLQEQLQERTNLHVTVKRLDGLALDLQQVVNRGGVNYLMHLPGQQTIISQNAPTIQNSLINVSKKGYVPALYWDGHSWQSIYALGGFNTISFLYQPSGLTYQTTHAPGGQLVPAYKLVPARLQHAPNVALSPGSPFRSELVLSTQQGPEVMFRNLAPLHVPGGQQSPVYETQFVGQFSNASISSQFSNPLNWLPDTTYASQPAQLRYDPQGHPVPSIPLYPTTNPAGFALQPPVALTTLDAAQRIFGDKSISAIRVRVAGVESANQASWNKVAQIAQQIRQTTGLQVLVTLGSSPQPTLVYVPGLAAGQNGSTRPIAPLGWVQDSWIYVGAAVVYLAQLGSTRLLFLGTILLVCLGYLIVTFSALVSAQRKEFAVLSALGWRPWQPVRLFLGQALVLGLVGGLAGIIVALLIAAAFGATPILLVVIWTLPAILLLGLVSIVSPLWHIWHIRPAEALRAGSPITPGRGLRLRFSSLLPPFVALSLNNLTRVRLRAMIAIGSIFFSALLITVLFNGLLAFRQSLQGTLLGSYVLLQTQIPQIAGAVFAVMLTFLSIADLLLLQARERQQEIGLLRAVGWRPVFVRRLFIQDGLLLAFCGGLPGVLAALLILMLQHTAQDIIFPPLIAFVSLSGMLVIGALAALPALRVAERMQVVDVLRAE